MTTNKVYLGDGVYADMWPPDGLVLTTEDGLRVTNEIFLENWVYRALLDYVARLNQQHMGGE